MTALSPTHSRRRIVKGAAWAAPVVAVTTSAPSFASSQCIDPVNRHRAELEVEILTDTWPGYRCHDGVWYGGAETSPNPTNFDYHRHFPLDEPIKARATLTVAGPDPIPAGARFIARVGQNGEIYNSEITQITGSAEQKFSGPTPTEIVNISWAREWTTTAPLEPGETFIVEWILNFPDGPDNSGGTHFSAQFLWPQDSCSATSRRLHASHRSSPETATPENPSVFRSYHVRYVNPKNDDKYCVG